MSVGWSGLVGWLVDCVCLCGKEGGREGGGGVVACIVADTTVHHDAVDQGSEEMSGK